MEGVFFELNQIKKPNDDLLGFLDLTLIMDTVLITFPSYESYIL